MNPATFTVFEHQSLVEGHEYNGVRFEAHHRLLLENAFREKNFPFYSLVRRGVRFCEYVGIFCVGSLQIEVLPKAGKHADQQVWRTRLVEMLQFVGEFDVAAPSSSLLKLQSGSFLDLYCLLFVEELEKILHHGLLRKYQQTRGNARSLKGTICFAQHLQQNLTHQERFFVRSASYSYAHPINAILYTTLCLLRRLNVSPALRSRVGALFLRFPQLQVIRVNEEWFTGLHFDRKSERYRTALNIARLLLLNYHPDVVNGKDYVLAMMFDMNVLWEAFVGRALQRFVANSYPTWAVRSQAKRLFWRSTTQPANVMNMKPDLVVDRGDGVIVLDAKWKNLSAGLSPHDLRQMYAYSKFHNDAETILVYPGGCTQVTTGYFMDRGSPQLPAAGQACRLAEMSVDGGFSEWRDRLGKLVVHCNFQNTSY